MANMVMVPRKSLKERLSSLDKISEAINKKAEKVIVGRIGKNEAIAEKLRIKFISTVSSEINSLMGGGYPRGRTTLIAGLEDSGKTSRLLEDIGYNMKIDPDFIAGWVESEGSLEEKYLKKFGIDPDRFVYIETDKESAAEKTLDRVEALIASNNLDIIVINSLKCLVPKKEYDDSFEDSQVGLQARMNNKMQRKFTAIISEANLAFVLITHLHTDIAKAMSHDPYTVSGGLGIRFGASIILDFRKRAIGAADPITRDEGVKIHISQKKNHCTPGRNVYLQLDYYAIFGEGTEQLLSTLNSAIESGVLISGGAWIHWYEEDGKTDRYKWNGKEKYRQFMRENPEIFEELKSLVKPKSLSCIEIAKIKAEEEKVNTKETEDELSDIAEEALS